MRVLALDQASRVSGWAIFDEENLEQYGKIDVSKYYELGERLHQIRKRVKKIIEDEQIDLIILEDIYLDGERINNVQTFKALAEVFGVLYELCIDLEKPVEAVLAKTWRSTLDIKGKTRPEQKQNAQNWVVSTYKVKVSEDVADAICIGAHKVRSSANEWGE